MKERSSTEIKVTKQLGERVGWKEIPNCLGIRATATELVSRRPSPKEDHRASSKEGEEGKATRSKEPADLHEGYLYIYKVFISL